MYYIKFKIMLKYIRDIYIEFENLLKDKRFIELEFYLRNISYYSNTFQGLNYLNQNQIIKAKKCFEICDEIDPANWETQVNLSNVYYKNKNLEKALFYVQKALNCPNGYQEDSLYNLAVINSELHNTEVSLQTYKNLLELNPNHLMGKYNYSAELLKNGYFEKGWEYYECRFERFDNLKNIKKEFSDMTFWNGENLENKNILIFNEQGTGDLFHFIRFSKNLKELGAKAILLANQNIKSLLINSPLVDEIIINKNEYLKIKDKVDYVVSVCSLPFYLKLNDPKEYWKENYISCNKKLDFEKEKLNIGLVYCGSHLHPYDWKRSIKLSSFSSFQKLDKTNIYILQKFTQRKRMWETEEVDPFDVPLFSNMKDLDDFINDYSDTAAVINSLDLIITVDTSIAHLAGAMGKKVILLVDFNNDWRWGYKENTIWYPTIEIIRQEKPFEGWEKIIEKARLKCLQNQNL